MSGMVSAVEGIPSRSGTYLLVLELRTQEKVVVGALGGLKIQEGIYLYVGSAFGPGGLQSRIARHIREEKRAHWHIDYLRPQGKIVEIWYLVGEAKIEHRAADLLAADSLTDVPFPGFGASDCSCSSHFFYVAQRTELPVLSRLFNALGRIEGEWQRLIVEGS